VITKTLRVASFTATSMWMVRFVAARELRVVYKSVYCTYNDDDTRRRL